MILAAMQGIRLADSVPFSHTVYVSKFQVIHIATH